MLKRTEVITVRGTYQSLLVILGCFSKGIFQKFLTELERSVLFQPGKIVKSLNMLTIPSDLAKYYCVYIQGAVAFQRLGILTHSVKSCKQKQSKSQLATCLLATCQVMQLKDFPEVAVYHATQLPRLLLNSNFFQ